MTSLSNQLACSATASTKIHSTLLAIALVDALGGPAEFHSRFKFPPVFSMIPNKSFGLPAGVWTDDTSMTLCLARSLARSGSFDEEDQMNAYTSWFKNGTLSAVDRCFDIGATIRQAIRIYDEAETPEKGLEEIKEQLSGTDMSGNGSLMRVAPIGLAYWRSSDDEIRQLARRSSVITHPSSTCLEACEVWSLAIAKIMQATTSATSLSKLDLLHLFNTFSYTDSDLRAALACEETTDSSESYLQTYHPILKLIARVRIANPGGTQVSTKKQDLKKKGNLFDKILSATDKALKDPAEGKLPALPSATELPSTGYVLDTMVAALYCFFSTTSFEDGAIVAVNLGDDTDTVGAVYASIAGCFYGCDDGSPRSAEFMSPRVEEWITHLKRKSTISEVAGELIKFADSQI